MLVLVGLLVVVVVGPRMQEQIRVVQVMEVVVQVVITPRTALVVAVVMEIALSQMHLPEQTVFLTQSMAQIFIGQLAAVVQVLIIMLVMVDLVAVVVVEVIILLLVLVEEVL
jgi:hypothetical protein